MALNRSILVVDDEAYAIQSVFYELIARGFTVRHAVTVARAKEEIIRSPPDVAIVDVMLPMGTSAVTPAESVASRGGFRSGQVLAQWIKDNYPSVQVLGFSLGRDDDVERWFRSHTAGFLYKSAATLDSIADTIQLLLERSCPSKLPVPFIVHGHDDDTRRELEDYLQNRLGFPEPIVLHEQPSFGRTILEKFEQLAETTNLVFVLLTPDDLVATGSDAEGEKRRARQNVIFELGFFLGSLGRRSGRVLLLHKGPIELPSDLSGLAYVDISNGVESAGETIRRELKPILRAPA